MSNNININDLFLDIKDNVINFLKRIDDLLLDLNPCPECHNDRVICPNCSYVNHCEICIDGLLCPKCHKESYLKYLPYFEAVNAIAADRSKFTQDEVFTLLDNIYKNLNK